MIADPQVILASRSAVAGTPVRAIPTTCVSCGFGDWLASISMAEFLQCQK